MRSPVYKEYWKRLQQFLRTEARGVRSYQATENPWMYLNMDARPAFGIASYNHLKQALQMSLRIDGTFAGDYYSKLVEERKTIGHELGCELDWVGHVQGGSYHYYQLQRYLRNSDPENRERWPEYIAWQADMAERFRKCFRPRMKTLAVALDDIHD